MNAPEQAPTTTAAKAIADEFAKINAATQTTGTTNPPVIINLYTIIDTNKPAVPYIDNKAMFDAFDNDVGKLETAGKAASDETDGFEKKGHARTIYDFTKIIGVHDKYFNGVTADKSSILLEHFRKSFKGLRSDTSVFHLLSRKYRGNDTKQASADARVLNYAYGIGKDETTFPDWIKERGGLNAARLFVIEEDKKAKEALGIPVKELTKEARKVLFERAELAIQKIAKAHQTLDTYVVDQTQMPDLVSALKPYGDSKWRMLVVNLDDEGKLHFHTFYKHVPDTSHLTKVSRPNVSGTSDSTWPDWMIEKKDESKTKADDQAEEGQTDDEHAD